MNEFIEKESGVLREKYYLTKHSSGLSVYIIPKEHKKAFALFGTRYGSIDRVFKTQKDADFVTVPDGIAHFLEHKLFENADGTDTFSLFAANGANCNAYTSNDMTAYLFSATERYYENLKILLQFVTTPFFSKETVEKELGIIGQEIRMCNDDPFHALYYGLLDALYVNHNVKVDVAGTEETISHITSDILYRCYNTFYNLNNMELVLCGAWERDKVVAVLDEVLKKSEKVKITRSIPSEPKRIHQKRVEKSFPVAMPMFAAGLKESDLPRRSTGADFLKREAEHEILADILFGKSSDFYNELYDEGMINEKFSTEYNLSESYGYLLLFGETRKPYRVYKRIRETVKNAKSFITPDSFERAKRAVYSRSVQDWNSTSEIAEAFLDFSFSGADMLDYPAAIAAVTEKDLINRIEKSYKTRMMALSVVTPIGGKA